MTDALTLAVAEHAGLFQELHTRQAAVRAHLATDPIIEEGYRIIHDLNAAGPGSKLTPLLTACLKGDAADVQLLLAFGADPATEGDVDDTTTAPDEVEEGHDNKCREFPLSIAARDGHEAIATMLLAHKDVDADQATTDTGTTAFNMCCHVGNINICKMLLARDDVDVNRTSQKDGFGTPLVTACAGDQIELIKLLLACDAIDVNKASMAGAGAGGVPPLVLVCLAGDELKNAPEIVAMLLACDGIEVNNGWDDEWTPLYIACTLGHTAIVAMLLARAARDVIEVNKAAVDGATPLLAACHKGHTDIIRILLADGRADVHKATIDDDGKSTPLHAAAAWDYPVAAQLLVVYGASLTATNTDGQTPAQLATLKGHHVLAGWLTAVSGWSPLRVAAGSRLHKEAALLLRQGRVDPDDPAATSVEGILQLVATSQAKPSSLPWPNAPPICKATIKLMADATCGWHRTTHWLHHKAVRDAVFAVVVVAGRLQTKDALPAEALPNVLAHADADSTARLPLLPIEIWLFAMRFFQRSWWGVISEPIGSCESDE